MYPTLVAVEKLGGSAAISELDELVLEVANVTEEQLAVEYPAEASSSESKVVHRLHWARTYLKAIGALDNSTRGIWTMTGTGTEYLELGPVKGDEELRSADNAVRAERRKARKDRGDADDEEHDEAEKTIGRRNCSRCPTNHESNR